MRRSHTAAPAALLDAAGRVIGINAQIRSDSAAGRDRLRGADRFGPAVLPRSVDKGTQSICLAGVQAEDLTPSLAQHLGLGVEHGALVDHVTPGGPAESPAYGAAEQETFLGETVWDGGDVVTAVDGRSVADADALVRIVTTLTPGDSSRFSVVRGSRRLTLSIRLGARPAR